MAITRTVQSVVEYIQEHENIAAPRCIELLNEAHLYIMGALPLVPDQTTNISLTSGTREYALPDNVVNIWDAAYYYSASGHKPLTPTNVDTIYQTYGPNWELISSGTPWAFYERGGNIGFFPAPDTTTSGGYPIVTLYYTQATSLSATSTMPTNINTIGPWIYYVLKKQCVIENPKMLPIYEKKFTEAMHELREYIYRRVPRDRPRLGLKVPRVRRP